MELDILNIDGTSTGRKVKLPENIFGIEPNDHAIYLSVKQYLAGQRQGTHKTKPRNEVTGSTKKIKKQKGTGTARAGDIKNPLFKGGGRIFGPEPRSYDLKVNKKVKAIAKKSVLTYKARENNLSIIESITVDEPRTKLMIDILGKLGVSGNKVLFIIEERDSNLMLATRNIPNAMTATASNLNIYDLMNADKLVLSEGSLKIIEETFAPKAAANA